MFDYFSNLTIIMYSYQLKPSLIRNDINLAIKWYTEVYLS